MFDEWRPYVSAAERQRMAEREVAKLRKRGRTVSPVVIEGRGRAIARTFWGKAWCDNLERYSDYSNRLPRGRTYVRNGSVVHLQVVAGEVEALVSGSAIYKVAVKVSPVPKARWSSLCRDCAGAIDSLVELLQGRFSRGVMERICQQEIGLFPSPGEIQLSCSCPDWASMCKHVAAVLYGIGTRLDERPELLFKLRKVDEKELIVRAGQGLSLARRGPSAERVLEGSDLSELFGLDMATPEGAKSGTDRPRTARSPRRIARQGDPGADAAIQAEAKTPKRRTRSARARTPVRRKSQAAAPSTRKKTPAAKPSR